MPGSLSRTVRVSALALVLAGAGLQGGAHVDPASPRARGTEANVPEAYEAPVADGAACRGGVSDADDWLG